MTQDGPTFVASVGWDWIPAIRDREMGLWQKVTLSSSGPVVLQNPLLTSDLPLPQTNSADLTLEVTVKNLTDAPQSGVLRSSFADANLLTGVSLAPNESKMVKLTPQDAPQLRVLNPRLWWPNGFGEPNLYTMRLRFEMIGGADFRRNPFQLRHSQNPIRSARLRNSSPSRSTASASSARAAAGDSTRP